MRTREFRPLPDEFNRGYHPVKREKEEDKKRHHLWKKVMIFAAAVVILLPVTVNVGLWRPEAKYRFALGTYEADGSILHLEEDSGWFYNGEAYIPLSFNAEEMSYHASGAFPAQNSGGSKDAEYYSAEAGGKIVMTAHGILLRDPFSQQEKEYLPSEDREAPAWVREEIVLSGRWNGYDTPQTEYPAVWPESVYFVSDHTAVITLTGQGIGTHAVLFHFERDHNILTFTAEEPIELTASDGVKEIRYLNNEPVQGILYITDEGVRIGFNLFHSQIFG